MAASSRSAAQAARAGRSADRRSDRRGPEPNFAKMESATAACGGPSGSRCRPRARESMDKEEERAP